MKNKNIKFPDWATWAWRGVRSGLAGGIASVLALQLQPIKPDFSDARTYFYALTAAFISGFISASFLAFRDLMSGGDKSSGYNQIPL